MLLGERLKTPVGIADLFTGGSFRGRSGRPEAGVLEQDPLFGLLQLGRGFDAQFVGQGGP